MSRGRVTRWVAAALVATASAGCRAASTPSIDTATHTPPAAAAVAPPDSAAFRGATAALTEFLEASREGSPTRDQAGRLSQCPGGEAAAQGPMLAAFELLPPSARADTVVGRAVVTTVAEQDVDRQHRGYFIARMRVRRDTLEWDVLRSESGDWVVCNGLRFGLNAPDSLTAWRPAGASRAAAQALADSIGNAK